MKTVLLLTSLLFGMFSNNIYGTPDFGKDRKNTPTDSLVPNITITGIRSRVLPATDGSRTVPLEVSTLLTCKWIDVSNNEVVGIGSTFFAPIGQYRAVMIDLLGIPKTTSIFTVVDANGDSKPDNAKNLAASLLSPTAIRLTWDKVGTSNSTVNEIYRSTRPGSQYVLLHVTSADSDSFIDQDLNANTTYYYLVRNVNENAAASLSQEVSATTSDDDKAPTSPTNLQVVASTMTTLSFKWNESTDNVGVALYYIYLDGVKVDSTTSLDYTLTGLASNTSYTLSIGAVDFTGNLSVPGNTINVSTKGDVIAPTPPVNLQKVTVTVTSIEIRWMQATDNIAVTHYNIYLNGVYKDSTSALTYTVKGLLNNTNYLITVKAADFAGNTSVFSNAVITSTLPDVTAPTAPSNLILANATFNSLQLQWDTATDDVAVIKYLVYVNGAKLDSITSTGYTIKNLQINTAYSINVKAADQAGNISLFSEILKAITLKDTSAPTVPANLKVTLSTLNSLSLNWDSSTDNIGVTRYDVYVNGVKKDTTSSSFIDLSKLIAATNYTVTVKAADLAGNTSAFSASVTATTTGDNIAPAAPVGLKVLYTTRSSVELYWSKSTDNIGVAGYDIYINGTKKYTTTAPSIVAENLTANLTYSFYVTAVDISANTSASSNQVSAVTKLIGLKYKFYEGSWSALPNFKDLAPSKVGASPNVDLSTRKTGVKDNYAFVWEGYIKITTPGLYTFGTISDAGSKFYFNTLYSPDAVALVNNDGLHGAETKSATVYIKSAGVYPVAITYFQRTGGAAMFTYWKGPRINWQLIPNSAYSDTQTTFSLFSFLTSIFNNFYEIEGNNEVVNTTNTNTDTNIKGVIITKPDAAKNNDFNFKSYPSPFVDRLRIEFNNVSMNSKVNVTMFNISGKAVYSTSFNNVPAGTQAMNLQLGDTNLAAGVYIITASVNGIPMKSVKVVKGL
ncbi:MAG: PA14 domain-containing protein [Chitinophagaceae bacterium]